MTDTTTTSTAQDWLPNDTATISSVGGTALNGNVAFTLHDGAGCSGTVLYSSLTNAVSGSSPQIVSTSNTTIKVTSSGTVSWEVVYTSNNANVSGSNSCETTVLTITN